MKTLIALALAILLAAPVAAQNTLRPEHFAERGNIQPGGDGPFHQVVLPIAVYQGSRSPDLADLRVFNGQGEALPYSLLRRESPGESHVTETAVPFFPLLQPEQKDSGSDVSVTVRQGKDGSLVAVRQSTNAANGGNVLRGIIIDASKLHGSIRSLRLQAGPSQLPFHPYVIESSTDLQHWRLLKGDAQLVHLEHEGRHVDSNTAEWDGASDQYLRLLWADAQQAPAIKSVLLGTVETSARPVQRIWSGQLGGLAVQPNVYEYVLPGQMPLERLRINLPQVNTLVPLDIQHEVLASVGRHHPRPRQYWETLAHAVVYRLEAAPGEVKSADISLPGGVENRLRLVIDARSGGIGAPPELQLGFVPQVLVFLARGKGPFTLAWGADGVAPAALPVSTLVPGYAGTGKLAASMATLVPLEASQNKGPATGKAASAVAATANISSKWILWSVLLLGLLVLGGMAWALTRQIRQGHATKP